MSYLLFKICVLGILSNPTSPQPKKDLALSPRKYDDAPSLFSSKHKPSESVGIKSYLSGASAIRHNPKVDYSEFNNSTGTGSGNMTNSRVLSPLHSPKPGQALRNNGLDLSSSRRNQDGTNGTSKFCSPYVPNVMEREIFRSTFINKHDSALPGQKTYEGQQSPPTSYRRNEL